MRDVVLVLCLVLLLRVDFGVETRTLQPTETRSNKNTHRHEEFFLPLGIDADGKVEGLLIDDMEAEKGPLVIEEVVDSSGEIVDVVIERASDITADSLASKRRRPNRKLGTDASANDTPSAEGEASRRRSLLPLAVLIITVAFSLGFVLSMTLAEYLPRFTGGVLMTRKQRLGLNKKLSMKPQAWQEHKDLYSPVKSPVRSPSQRSAKKAATSA